VIRDLTSVLPPESTIITHDSGSPREQLSAFYEARSHGGYVGWGHSTQLDNSALGNYERYMPEAVSRYSAQSLAGTYAQVAEALGAWSERVTEPDRIVPALRQALEVTASGQPALLEMITREEPTFSTFW
jgi:acetolactate synthase-1/2/3 large subunit